MRTRHCHIALGQKLLPVNRDMSFCVVLELFASFQPNISLLCQIPKGTKQVLSVAAKGAASSKLEIHDLQSTNEVAPIPTITDGIWNQAPKANKEKTVKIKTWSTLGKHTRKFHFDDT